MTQDQLSIMVIDVKVGECESILFYHPGKHFWLVTLTQDDAHIGWIISCVHGHEEVVYVLVSQPAPGGLVS